MKTEPIGISRYQPLIVIVGVAVLAAASLQSVWDEGFMRYFMGLFFALLAMFKLFDLRGFADGFQKYDVVAKQWRGYGYAYPCIELGLGLAYLADYGARTTYIVTIAVMAVSAAGVIREIRRGNKFQCACLGTVLKVPLSTVSIVENAGMGLMAAGMLLAH